MNSKINYIKSITGDILKYQFSYPGEFKKLVIYVNGAGPNTYNNTHQLGNKIFNYYDLFKTEFNKRGISYLSYNNVGVEISDEAPFYKLDEKVYNKNTPSSVITDLENLIKEIQKEYGEISIYLLGFSDGGIIASQIADRKNVKIAGLILASYCHNNLKDILEWQFGGNALFINWLNAFGVFEKGFISKEDFLLDKKKLKISIFGNANFEDIDINQDGKITIEDVKPLTYPYYLELINAINTNDEQWLTKNLPIKITSRWYQEMFRLKANKDILPKLDIPIYVLHGELDSNCPVSGVKDLEKLNKTNIKTYIFKDHDPDFNYLKYIVEGKISTGLSVLFKLVSSS